MSLSLLRRGLELLEHPGHSTAGKVKSKSSSSLKVNTNRQGVTKRVRGHQGPTKTKTTVKHKRIKSAVEEFRRKQKKNQTSSNLQYFLDGVDKTTTSDMMKILNQNAGRQSRNHPEPKTPKTPKTPETQSLFTEEQFQQFQKEFFGRTVEK